MTNPRRTEEDYTTGLMAMVAWAGNATRASEALKAEGKLDIKPETLRSWATERFADRYDELREKYSEQLEGHLIHEMREMVSRALEVQSLAVEKTRQRLEANKDNDPARTAANIATVAQKNTDKMLSLSGRPTSIREDRRNPEELLRKLIAIGVLEAPHELPAGDVQEEGAENGHGG